jgi:hypothetical protein
MICVSLSASSYPPPTHTPGSESRFFYQNIYYTSYIYQTLRVQQDDEQH